MKILDVHVYRDGWGGTKMIETDQGRFWIPNTKDRPLSVMKGENLDEVEEASIKEIIEILEAMSHESSTLHWIKRHI